MTSKLMYFVTGTDTGVGKTYCSVGLLKAFQRLNYTAIGMKPVASGAFWQDNKLYNQDALDLNAASSHRIAYEQTNPFVFEPAIAPHIAAARAGISLNLRELIAASHAAFNYPSDIHLVEGAGGWSLPLNQTETMIDFVAHFKMRVIMVVGIRLGCINHAMLTYQAIKHANLSVVGWIANCLEPDVADANEIIETVRYSLGTAHLGSVAYNQRPEDVLQVEQIL